jgi:hypothetical protein
MAVVGHWDTLADAQELTQSMLLQGVIQTVVEAGQLTSRLPVKQVTGKDLLYNREDSWTASSGASFFDIREQIPWSSDVTYTPVTVPLKRIARQDPIDNFVRTTYSSVNDYTALMLQQLAKRMTRFVEHHIIYGDVTYGGSKQFDGLHALAEENTGDLDIDEGEGALSLMNLRKLLDAAKVDTEADAGASGRSNVIILVPREIGRRLDAGVQEAGMVRSSVTHSMSQITMGRNEFGARTTFFDGIPIVRSDFLVAEQANTGVGSDVRAANSSGTKQYSIFVIRLGQTEEGGLSMLFGGDSGTVGEIFKHTHFDVLENYDSGGERLVAYTALALGAGHSIGRIYDITDAEVTP